MNNTRRRLTVGNSHVINYYYYYSFDFLLTWQRQTTSADWASMSTTLPLPSSPHCVPTTTVTTSVLDILALFVWQFTSPFKLSDGALPLLSVIEWLTLTPLEFTLPPSVAIACLHVVRMRSELSAKSGGVGEAHPPLLKHVLTGWKQQRLRT